MKLMHSDDFHVYKLSICCKSSYFIFIIIGLYSDCITDF